MKAFVAASLIALSFAPLAVSSARAEDVGAAIARGAIRGAIGGQDDGDRGYRGEGGYRGDGYRRGYDRDRSEGRSAYERGGYGGGGGCRTVTIERDDGSVSRVRRCD